MQILRIFQSEEAGKLALAEMTMMFNLHAHLEPDEYANDWVLFQEPHDQTLALQEAKSWSMRSISLGKNLKEAKKVWAFLKKTNKHRIIGDLTEWAGGYIVWII